MNIYEIYITFITEPDRSDDLFNQMSNSLEPMIKGILFMASKDLRDDLKQVLLTKISYILLNQKFKLDTELLQKIYEQKEKLNNNDNSFVSKFVNFSEENYLIYNTKTKENFEKFLNFAGQAKLLLFFKKTLYNCAVNFLKNDNKQKKTVLLPSEELDNLKSRNYNLDKDFFLELSNLLTKKEKQIINLLYKNYSQKIIASFLEVKPQYISNVRSQEKSYQKR